MLFSFFTVQNGPVNTKDNVTDEDFDRYMQTNQASQVGKQQK